MNWLLSSRYIKRLRRRSQAGQSLVILAIGFVALIGFVGIVTDVSLLFVRFSTLRRAVDAAAVAAAGQMRRIQDPTPANAIAEDQATSFANMNLAARQFIEVYGLSPSEVTVETCHAQNRNIPVQGRDVTLCTADERKLVRVTAQIDSPTTFFSLFGFQTIRLQASSTSETAVLDLVFIMDVSESMLNETTPRTWGAAGYNIGYIPPVPRLWETTPERDAWAALLARSNNQILADLNTLLTPLEGNASERQIRTYAIPGATGTLAVRAECQVRFWPGGILKAAVRDAQTVDDYIAALGGLGNFISWFNLPAGTTRDDIVNNNMARWTGFVPNFDFYGCCNDPNGDWNMTDLLCQPFRAARDASTDFMARLDFIRGDRVAIVTFDRLAYLIDPDPSTDLPGSNPVVNDTRDAMIYDQTVAQAVMRERVGVRTESSFYVDGNRDGRWDGFRSGGAARDWNFFNTNAVGGIIDHPTRFACPLDNAVLAYPYSLLRDANGGTVVPDDYRDGFAGGGGFPARPVALDMVDTIPSWYNNLGASGASDRWIRSGVVSGFYEFYDRLRRSYEYNASCAGTNIGDGMALASQTLGRLGRREGAVWIMVLLSDGAAGASSPAYRNGTVATQPNVYNAGTNGGTNPVAGQYGGYGLCPYGDNPATNSAYTGSNRINAYRDNGTPYPAELMHDITFPFCSDIQPQTRHFCADATVPTNPADAPNIGPVRVELSDDAACERYYDTDDYARDWADYIAVRGVNVFRQSATNPILRNTSDTLLPTIFTIGFGLGFDRTSCGNNNNMGLLGNPVYDCNYEDYLGEELLRYIADAGDNFRIDNDYWQQELGYRIPNRVADLAAGQQADWGQRGQCETETGTRGVWSPLAPGADCGNYWSADAGDLDEVFQEIANRMFTRLAG
jgi:Flp pilus assembly protein TadG